MIRWNNDKLELTDEAKKIIQSQKYRPSFVTFYG